MVLRKKDDLETFDLGDDTNAATAATTTTTNVEIEHNQRKKKDDEKKKKEKKDKGAVKEDKTQEIKEVDEEEEAEAEQQEIQGEEQEEKKKDKKKKDKEEKEVDAEDLKEEASTMNNVDNNEDNKNDEVVSSSSGVIIEVTCNDESYKKVVKNIVKDVVRYPDGDDIIKEVSKEGSLLLDEFIYYILQRVVTQSIELVTYNEDGLAAAAATSSLVLSSREIQTSIRLILPPGELSNNAVNEGSRALTKCFDPSSPLNRNRRRIMAQKREQQEEYTLTAGTGEEEEESSSSSIAWDFIKSIKEHIVNSIGSSDVVASAVTAVAVHLIHSAISEGGGDTSSSSFLVEAINDNNNTTTAMMLLSQNMQMCEKLDYKHTVKKVSKMLLLC